MKQLKKPTREQRKLIQEQELNPAEWMIERDTTTEMVLVHRKNDNKKKIIPKGDKYDD